tara:strand:+ start:1066 stop:1803 length:738 start_codon:yes stop_codon:yes gene_type:complete
MIPKLQKLGLSPYEAKCYVALLKWGNLGGKELAKKSHVPPTSVYRNLESLREKGFVQLLQKEPLVYQAVNPEIALTHYVNYKKVLLEEVENAALEELNTIKRVNVAKKEEVLEIYSGREQSYAIGKKLIKESKKEFLLIGKGSKQSILDLIHELKSAVEREVKVRFIITTQDDHQELVQLLKDEKISVKYYPLQNFSLLVRDGEESQIVIKKSKEKRMVMRIKSKDLSQAHQHYFNSIWRKATPV